MKRDGEFKYKVCGMDRIVDEKGSAFIALRKIAWGTAPDDPHDIDDEKVDIRKYYGSADGEKMNKGVSFLTDEGPHELARILLEEGYGDTGECLKVLKQRCDFKQAIYFAYDEEQEPEGEFFDPRSLMLDHVDESNQSGTFQ